MPTTSPKPPTSDWDDRCIPVTHEKVHSTVMGIPLKDASSKKRHDTRKQCYLGLKALISNLEEIPNRPVLDQAEQQRLGICTELSVEPKNASCFDHEVRFFTPSLPENLPFPPCRPSLWGDEQGRSYHESVWPRSIPHDEDAAELVEDYYDGWHLANVITHHVDMLRWKYPTAWQQTWFHVRYVYDMFSKRKPHQILLMISDHPVEENSLLRSEVPAMTTFMKWKMQSMRREQSLVYPVMVISIMNLLKLRILQGHFDGTLNICRSKVYDFAVDDHEDMMKLVICWLRSMAHGDTTLSMDMPIFRDESHDEDADGNS